MAAGLDHRVSTYTGTWCSRPDPSLAEADLAFRGTPTATWLPEVVMAHRAEAAPESHPGYSLRGRELELATFLRET